MGCWNGTCFISGLAIREGEDAVVIPTLRYEAGTTKGTLFPIHGKYNDYGGLEGIENLPEYEVLLSTINEKLQLPKPEHSAEITGCIVRLNQIHKVWEKTTEPSEGMVSEFLELTRKISAIKNSHQYPITKGPAAAFRADWEGPLLDSMEKFVSVLERSTHHDTIRMHLAPSEDSPDGTRMGMLMIHGAVWAALKTCILHEDKDSIYVEKELPTALRKKWGRRVGKHRSIDDATGAERLDYLMDRHVSPIVENFTPTAVLNSGATEEMLQILFEDKNGRTLSKDDMAKLHEGGLLRHMMITGAIETFYSDKGEYSKYHATIMPEILLRLQGSEAEAAPAVRRLIEDQYVLTNILFSLRKTLNVEPFTGSQSSMDKVAKALGSSIIQVCESRHCTD